MRLQVVICGMWSGVSTTKDTKVGSGSSSLNPRCHSCPCWLSLLLLSEIFGDAVEDAVDEVQGFGAGEFTRNFESFVDDDRGRSFREADELGDSCAHEVAINGGHAVELPVSGMLFD